jgi:hypothetical protein
MRTPILGRGVSSARKGRSYSDEQSKGSTAKSRVKTRPALALSVLAIAYSAALLGTPVGASAAPLPLGTLSTTQASDSSCPAGHTCLGFQVVCPGVQLPARGFLATATAQGQPRGVVLFATGGPGTSWWSQSSSAAAAFISDLRADGFMIAQLRWQDGWLVSAPGEDAGSGHLGCRPATVVKWVHDNLYQPLGLQPARGACGYCITGNSGGASQVSYALSHYGLDALLDAVVPTSGPPHAAQAKGCLRNPGEEPYWYENGSASTIDSSYGFAAGQGPCVMHDSSFIGRWTEESVDTGGNDYSHAETRIHIILGGQDTSSAPPHAGDYMARLLSAGSPYATLEVVPQMAHPIQASADGLAALRRTLLADARSAGPCSSGPGSGGYETPSSACSVRTALVPVFAQCGTAGRPANGGHAAPLSTGACEPPLPAGVARVGTGSTGIAQLAVVPGNLVTAADEADVFIHAAVDDVRSGSPSGLDYDPNPSGADLSLIERLRITDSASGPSGSDAATASDLDFVAPVDCVSTADPAIGSDCFAGTSADAILPDAIKEGKRMVVQVFRLRLADAGPDGARGNGDDRLFEQQGLYIP